MWGKRNYSPGYRYLFLGTGGCVKINMALGNFEIIDSSRFFLIKKFFVGSEEVVLRKSFLVRCGG